jgi:multidrug efflux system outer membrane protein
MNLRLLSALIILTIAIFIPAAAQETPEAGTEPMVITVDEAVEMALENNISLQISEIELRAKRRAMQTVWNNFLPSINASVGLTGNRVLFGESTVSGSTLVPINDLGGGVYDQVTSVDFEQELEPTTGLTAGLQMSLPINIALGNGIRQTVLEYQGGLISVEAARKQLEVNIRKQFWLIKALEAGIELERRNLDTLQRRYEQTRANYDNGLVPELALLSSRVSLESARPTLMRRIAELENTVEFFKFLIGVSADTGIVLEGKLEADTYRFDAGELIDRYLSGRLDVREVEHNIVTVENAKTITALYGRSPTLSLGLNWGTQIGDEPFKADSWDPFVDNLSLSAMLVIPLDGLIPGSSTDVGLSELQDSIDTLVLTRDQVYDNAGIEIRNLVRQLENSRATIDAYQYNLELAQQNYRLNNEAYELGTVELLEVESAQDNLYQAEYAILFETYTYLAALLDLEYAVNTELDTILAETGAEKDE